MFRHADHFLSLCQRVTLPHARAGQWHAIWLGTLIDRRNLPTSLCQRVTIPHARAGQWHAFWLGTLIDPILTRQQAASCVQLCQTFNHVLTKTMTGSHENALGGDERR
jgi:hypothetical protein